MFKNKITKKEFEEKKHKIVPHGNGGHIIVPKKFIGLLVKIKLTKRK